MAALVCAAPEQPPNSVAEIQSVLSAQQDAWNRGDIDAFMNGYARSASTVFVSEDEVRRGWETVRDRYRVKYSDRAKMGTLSFSDIEVTMLSPDAAVVLGRWRLKRANDEPHGRFTLIFKRLPEGWRIVHDHTSRGSTAVTQASCLTGRPDILARRLEARVINQARCLSYARNLVRSFSWILSKPPLLKTTTTSFGRSIGMIRSTIAFAFCS